MRLLFVTPTPPDRLDRDGMTQVAHFLIRELGQADQVDVWTLTAPDDSGSIIIPGAKHVRAFPRQPTSLLHYYLHRPTEPYFQARHESTELHAALKSLQPNDYDLVVFHTPFVAHYILDCPLPAVINIIDALSDWFPAAATREINPWKKTHLITEGHRAKKMERTILPRARAVIVVGEQDAKSLQSLAPQTPVSVIPIGINTDIFFPPTALRQPATIIMTGIMNYPPNVDAAVAFVQEVWPTVRASHPTAEVRLVGKAPSPRVQDLSRVAGVHVTGQVPSVAEELRRATIAVSPLRFGTGYKIKINEALACGTPLVASPASLAGTGAVPNQDCLLADSPTEWIGAVNRLLDSPAEQQQLSAAAAAFAAKRTWPVVAAQYRKVYAQAIL